MIRGDPYNYDSEGKKIEYKITLICQCNKATRIS